MDPCFGLLRLAPRCLQHDVLARKERIEITEEAFHGTSARRTPLSDPELAATASRRCDVLQLTTDPITPAPPMYMSIRTPVKSMLFW